MLIILALFLPRLVTAYLWVFTEWFSGVFETRFWPILGFIFMPYTTIWYSAVSNWYDGAWGFWQIVVLIIAIIFDISSNSKGTKKS